MLFRSYRVWNKNQITTVTAMNVAFDENSFRNRDSQAKFRFPPDEITNSEIPGLPLVSSVRDIHSQPVTPKKPAAPDTTLQPQNRTSVNYLNSDVEATMMMEPISLQVLIDMNIEEPESLVVLYPPATNGTVGQRQSTHEH